MLIFNKREPSQKKLDFLEHYFQEGLELVSSSVGFDMVDSNSCEELGFLLVSSKLKLLAGLLDLKAPVKE